MKNKLSNSILLLAIVAIWACNKKPVPETVSLNEWKFKTGDSLNWAKPEYNDAAWDTLVGGINWESQGYPGYDGYAWYRIKFDLPAEMLSQAFFKDSLQIDLGKVDDTEETYLNGHLLGKNGVLVKEDDTTKFESDSMGYYKKRQYIISANDSRILWGKQNTIAVRVNDHGGGGGFYVANMFVALRDLKDYLIIDDITTGFQKVGAKNVKTIFVRNKSGFASIAGKMEVSIQDVNTGKNYFKKSWDINLQTGATDTLNFEFEDVNNARLVGTYTFM
jgi:alpha-galactosidase